jgi:RNA polymerase sigma-70 factor (ECF subfamily)
MRKPEPCRSLRCELELLEDVLAGDQRAWRHFQQRFEKLIGLCVRKVMRRYQARHTQDDVDDIVAEVWLLLLADDRRRLRSFDATRGLRLGTWLGQIARNHAIDHLRRRRRESYLEDIAEREQLAVCYATPHEHLERRQAYALAERAIERLKEHERRFLLSCYRDDQTPAQLARELGVSVNAVYSRRFKVRAKLNRIVSALDVATTPAPSTIAA